jgi:succinate dehydrogenase/fumarate reductase flavoprotein subunit
METTVEALFAAGENAGGFHGADRLGGNMLAGCIISGRIAGKNAAKFSKKRSRADQLSWQPVASIAGNPEFSRDYSRFITEIRRSAWDDILVIKSEDSIKRFKSRIDEIAREAHKAAGRPNTIPVEVKHLLILAKAIAATTVERKESRGGFYREDYPLAAQGTPETHLLALTEAGEVILRKQVLDPQWNPLSQNGLDNERWG